MASFNKIFHPSPRGRVRWLVAVIAILFVFSGLMGVSEVYNLHRDGMNEKIHQVSFLKWFSLPKLPFAPFRLGLDLKGGSHLVYEADVTNIPEADRDSSLEGARDVIERKVNRFGVAEPIVQTVKTGDTYRMIVELAGISDVNEAISMIGKVPLLEFKEEGAPELVSDQKLQLEEFNKQVDAKAADLLKRAKTPGTDFAGLVKEASEDEATKASGGELGWISGNHPMYGFLAQPASQTKVGEVYANVVADPANGADVLKVYESRQGQEVNARHILICYFGAKGCESEVKKEDARKQIEDLKKQATPQNFADLAKQHSTEPGAKERGGDLGWFGRGAMVKPFEDAVFAMQKGGISDIVETDFGFHLIYKVDERPITEYRVARLFLKKKTEADFAVNGNWKQTGLTGKQLQRAFVTVNPTTQLPEVSLQFNDEGKKLFAEITERNVNKAVAIFLDGEAISIPRVSQPITDGQAVIQGNFRAQEARDLANSLATGALPVPIKLISQQTVGASLGIESLQKSLMAGLIGFALVALFMILFYRLPGLLSVIALAIYTALTAAIFKIGGMTLSLSGIAGFILSVGMAVDANVLIFERMKEEVRSGKGLDSAIRDGFSRAWSSIRDSNVSSLITCVILYSFAATLIKGFALTLAIGILVSMFSAIFITRVLLKLVAGWKIGQHVDWFVPSKKREVTNVAIVGRRGIWLGVSALMVVVAVVGLFSFGLKFGIDFTGGSLMEVVYTNGRPSNDDARKVFEEHDIKDVEMKTAGDNGMLFRFKAISEDEHKAVLDDLKKHGELTEKNFESIGPVIGQELRDKSWKAAFIAILAILAYITYAFRKVSRPVASWKFGLTTVIALFHDLLVLLGVFAFLGAFAGIEINSSFIAAFLTVLGFSVHDTIVVFDRVRENLMKYNGSFSEIVNRSLNETIVRSINTSLTVLFTLLAIYLFGGESLKGFSLALLIGITAGTYSSIFVASPILVVWQTKKLTGGE